MESVEDRVQEQPQTIDKGKLISFAPILLMNLSQFRVNYFLSRPTQHPEFPTTQGFDNCSSYFEIFDITQLNLTTV